MYDESFMIKHSVHFIHCAEFALYSCQKSSIIIFLAFKRKIVLGHWRIVHPMLDWIPFPHLLVVHLIIPHIYYLQEVDLYAVIVMMFSTVTNLKVYVRNVESFRLMTKKISLQSMIQIVFVPFNVAKLLYFPRVS